MLGMVNGLMVEVEVEVSLKTSDVSLHRVISQALNVYLRAHFTNLSQNGPITMVDLGYISDLNNEIIAKLLLGKDDQMDLSKAELIVTLYVGSLYVSDVRQEMTEEIVDLELVLQSLDLMKPLSLLNGDSNSSDNNGEIHIDEMLKFKFLFYFNFDQTHIDLISSMTQYSSAEVLDEFDNITLNSNVSKQMITEKDYLVKAFEETSSEVQSFFNQSIDLNVLPSSKLQDVWDQLKLDVDFKNQVVKQLKGSSCCSTDNNLLRNNLFIFHGPTGSGKSTFCKTLAQKLSIHHQFYNNSSNTLLLQISCEKIFSKWYGESSQNLLNLFEIIKNLIRQNPKSLVILIIDEIETLASSRSQIIAKNETSDGIRVVNTLLTQLDSLKQFSNFLILATSNLIGSIDEAFLDRADGCFAIERPSSDAIRQILLWRLQKLIQSGTLVSDKESTDLKTQKILDKLSCICDSTLQLSGRSVSKIPQNCISELSALSPKPILVSKFLQSLSNTIILKVISLADKIQK
jgi:energy-coupling factor transporter ATP-binding protein EcfA2